MSNFYQSEKCFRRYEPAIYLAVQNFPKEVSFIPEGGRAITTETARCRDAITSWVKNRWETSTGLDPVKMSELVVYNTGDGTVKIAGRSTRTGTRTMSVRTIQNVLVSSEGVTENDVALVLEDINLVEGFVTDLDEGKSTEAVSFPHTPDNLNKVISAIGDRLNVAYYIKDNKITIF